MVSVISAIVAAGLIMAGLALGLGILLGLADRWLKTDSDPLVDKINQRLPQTQCAQCGYPGCRPYAQAIASGEADINQCPPGGAAGVRALADLLDLEAKPLDPAFGEEKPPQIALIDESLCIGCKLCIDACPVDAILGAPRKMHTVITAECTGCELCVPVCPVDCIDLIATPETRWRWPDPESNRNSGLESAA